MKVSFSPLVTKKLSEIKKKDNKLFRKTQQQLQIFIDNPKHPSLRIHKLVGKQDERFSISITRSIRMVFIKVTPDEAYFINIGTHEQVY